MLAVMTDSSHGHDASTHQPAPLSAGPSPGGSGRRAKLIATVGTGALFAGALAYVGLNDPHRPGSLFPQCIFKVVTGFECPACGGLRMTHDLLNGDLAAAVVDNVYLLILIPLLAGWFVIRRWQKRPVLPAAMAVTVVATAVVWTVVRNLPGFPLVPTIIGG